MATERLPVSVVIPAYNAARFLGDAIASVYAQTMKPHEVIVVDDGSSDGTGDVAQAWGAHVIRQANAGPSAARNAGILAASQPWVAFHDADDLWAPSKLELQWDALQRAPQAGIAYCDYSNFDHVTGETLREGHLDVSPIYEKIARNPLGGSAWLCDHASFQNAIVHALFCGPPTFVIRRDLLLSAGLFPVGIHRGEDWDLLMRLSTFTTAVGVELPLLRRRMHGTHQLTADQARMWTSYTVIADRVAAEPHRYPPTAAASVRKRRPVWLRRAGRKFFRSARFHEAAVAYRGVLRSRFDVAALACYVAALALRGRHGPWVYAVARVFYRRLGFKQRRRARLAALHLAAARGGPTRGSSR